MAVPADLVGQLEHSIISRRLGPDDLLFATREGTPISRNTFRTRIWRPAIKASSVDFDVRVLDLRHAHAFRLLACGSDLESIMDRMGHAQITTTQKYLHALPDADADAKTSTPRRRLAANAGRSERRALRHRPAPAQSMARTHRTSRRHST